MRGKDDVRKLLDAKIEAFQRLKHGAFRLGEGKIAQTEAQRRRREIAALRRELEGLV